MQLVNVDSTEPSRQGGKNVRLVNVDGTEPSRQGKEWHA